jgi:pyruvate/2-oxoglutarate dehydrogenase complex dihydrolipoamide acyltransferase (E2) component
MSPVSGTIVEHFATLEDNVVVGAALFSVDDSRAPAGGVAKPAPAAAPAAAAPAAPVVAAPAAASGHRTPLIKFLGKRALLPAAHHAPVPTASVLRAPSSADVLPFHMAKKIPLSPAEVAAINSGISFL